MTTKRCNKCNVEQPLEDFFKDRGFVDGHASICKICKTANTMAWRANNKTKYNAYMRQKNKDRYPAARLKRYGLTIEQHTAMLEQQKNVCAICAKPQGGIRPLCVDHHHDTGRVRGLLCYGCNRAVAILDNPELLAKALAYLGRT